MKTNYRRLAFVLLSSISAATMTASCADAGNIAKNAASATAARKAQGNAQGEIDKLVGQIDIPYEMFTLDNGLRVVVHTDKTAPNVYVGMTYLVGSKDEPPGKSGFAHLFEHLMFQETENRKGDYFEELNKSGVVELNGYTTTDRTSYYEIVPTEALDVALWMESDRMMHLLGAIDKASIDNQRDVVKNEKREDPPIFAKLDEAVLKALYPVGHPYHHSVIGSMEDLDNASLEDVKAWFREYYGASNAVLVLSGAVDAATAKEKVQKYFGAAPAGKPLATVAARVPELDQTKKDVLYDAETTQTWINWIWNLPPSYERETALVDLAARTLNKDNSPLKRKLVDELKLATEVSVYVVGAKLASTLVVDAKLAPDADLDKLRDAIDQVISEFLEKGPNQKLLDAVRLKGLVAFLEGQDRYTSNGSILENSIILTGDPEYYKKEMAWVNEATVADVRDAARKWMQKHRAEFTILPFPKYESAAKDADRSAVPPVTMNPQDADFPEIEATELDNGIKLILVKHKDVPLEYISIGVNTGFYADGSTPGVAELTMELLDKGAAGRSKDELAESIDAMAMSGLQASAHQAHSYLRFYAAAPYLDDSLALAADMLSRPDFPEVEVERAKERYLVKWREVEADPTASGDRLLFRAIYGAGKPGATVPTKEEISRLTREDIVNFHKREVTPQNVTILAGGGMDPVKVKEAINKAFGKWRGGSGEKSTLQLPGAALPRKERTILIDQPDAPQSIIYAFHAIPPYDPKTDATLELANIVIGGDFLARLNMNIREDKGWTYGIYSQMFEVEGSDQLFAITGKFQTDKTKEGMAEVQKELREFITTRPATSEELEDFRLAWIRSAKGKFDSTVAYLNSVEKAHEYGLPLDFDARLVSRLKGPTLEDVNAMARKTIKPDEMIWIIFGDLKEIEGPVRSLGYGEVEVWDGFGNRLR